MKHPIMMLNLGHSGLILFIFIFSNKQFLQQIHVKNVHPIYGAGIHTLDLQDMSHLPKPLESEIKRIKTKKTDLKFGFGLYSGMGSPLMLYFRVGRVLITKLFPYQLNPTYDPYFPALEESPCFALHRRQETTGHFSATLETHFQQRARYSRLDRSPIRILIIYGNQTAYLRTIIISAEYKIFCCRKYLNIPKPNLALGNIYKLFNEQLT